ncbi:MAG: NTP transferase domain-containing protein [Planctomycetia bacterium]|nr:NTP transferase domain-containing protein [Planctomycetia bacterium]
MATHAIIMAGGGGTRFWPRSRAARPKQFLKLTGDRSLIQIAFDRIEAIARPEHRWVVTGSSMASLVHEQLPDLLPDRLVPEPMGRDTAACIGVAAALVAQADPDAVMVVTPADHVIEPIALFQKVVSAAVELTQEHPQALVTFGIPPTYAATGFGYIERGEKLPGRSGVEAFRIKAFKEKPDAVTAQQYINAGCFYWNSGIFVWRAATILAELKRLHPTLHDAVQRIAAAWPTPDRLEVFRREFEPLKRISIDYAVMEHCQQGLVLPAPFSWDDVGSWQALERHFPQDELHNTVIGAEHIKLDTSRCIVMGDHTTGQIIATVGVEDLLIVREGPYTLIARRDDEAGIKKLVEHLKEKKREDLL